MNKAFVFAGFGCVLAACAGGTAVVVTHGPLGERAVVYEPVSRAMEVTAGELVLSEREATFKQRKGSMQFAFARRLDVGEVAQDSWFGGVGGPHVYLYKVANDSAYFEANKGGNGVCGDSVKWLAVSPCDNGDLSLCEVTDASGSLAPDRPTLCACGVYAVK